MLKYLNTQVTGAEVPDHISLCINLTNCPCHCKGCHSSYLAENIGNELTENTLEKLIEKNGGTDGIDCVSLMGGDIDPHRVQELLLSVKKKYGDSLDTCWYSGRDYLPKDMNLDAFDFVKYGGYKEEYGGLDSKKTNQVFYKVEHGKLKDITYKFWRQ